MHGNKEQLEKDQRICRITHLVWSKRFGQCRFKILTRNGKETWTIASYNFKQPYAMDFSAIVHMKGRNYQNKEKRLRMNEIVNPFLTQLCKMSHIVAEGIVITMETGSMKVGQCK